MIRAIRNMLADFFLWDWEDVRRDREVRRTQDIIRKAAR